MFQQGSASLEGWPTQGSAADIIKPLPQQDQSQGVIFQSNESEKQGASVEYGGRRHTTPFYSERLMRVGRVQRGFPIEESEKNSKP